jgi:hypothetical protein
MACVELLAQYDASRPPRALKKPTTTTPGLEAEDELL